MTAPDWLVWLTLVASFMAAIVVSTIVSVRSITGGDSIPAEWLKRSFFGTLAFVAVWAAYFIIGNIVASL